MRIRRAPRPGLSLLEVMLAMAIFLIAVVGLMELVNISSRQAFEISQVNRANQLLEDRLNAVTGGIVPLQGGQTDTPFDDDPDWSWSMQSSGENTPNLYRVTITVKWQKGNDTDHQWSVSRMVFDPAQKGTLEAPPSSSSSSSSSGTTGGK